MTATRCIRVVGVLALVIGVGCAAGDPGPRDGGGEGGVDGGGGGFDAGRIDGGTDAGPFEMVDLCESCAVHEQCGSLGRCVPLTDGDFACTAICNPDIPSCPRGFECVIRPASPDFPVCVPVGERCCIDQDADGYGDGVGCEGLDCDDDEISVNPGATELCNGTDDDCDGIVDEESSDCGGQQCRNSGTGYEEVTPGICDSGACIDGEATSCGYFSCELGEDTGDRCATTCVAAGVDDDTYCIGSAHCDLGGCVPDEPNGGVCDEDTDCASDHCDNGFCCNDGACCAIATDCPGGGGIGATCDDSPTCQGTRGEIICEMNQCATRSGVPDDSACTSTVEANTCGFFTSVYCSGSTSQAPPSCPGTCSLDTQCDADAHCDFSVCLPDLPDGERCDEMSDCASGHCQNGFCCASGDCCGDATHCPASYSTAPSCDTPAACQGTRDAATCVSSRCGTTASVPDDSACTGSIEASNCGLYPSRFCNGTVGQTAPTCSTMCSSDSECDSNAHCDLGMCTIDLPDGSPCDETSDCAGNHCQNGFCCATGDCCAVATNCAFSTYGEASICNSAMTCQGQRRDPVCNGANQCQLGGLVDDDSGCAGLVSNSCGLYPSVSCTTMTGQSPDQMSRCAMGCITSADCDAGAFCDAMGQCAPRGMLGDACTLTSQCTSGLSCTDGVCCSGSCSGTCVACNVPGSLGTCSPVPSGTDPAGECGGFSCATYYHGWSGDMCYRKADAPGSAVDCNGASACETPAEVCPSQGQGSLQIDCDNLCQSPTSGTCSVTSAGACNNITPSPSTQTCGVGACSRTVNRCNSGTQVTCTPGSPGTETCNAIDDNCNGVVDDGLPGDASESNNTCGTTRALGTVNTSNPGATMTLSRTVYPSGDYDFYSVRSHETDSTCHCCNFFCTDEDIGVTVRIDVPAGAGSYELCLLGTDTTCPTWSNCITVAAGNNGSRVAWRDGACGSTDDEAFRFRVRGVGAPAFQCAPYTLTVSGMGGCG